MAGLSELWVATSQLTSNNHNSQTLQTNTSVHKTEMPSGMKRSGNKSSDANVDHPAKKRKVQGILKFGNSDAVEHKKSSNKKRKGGKKKSGLKVVHGVPVTEAETYKKKFFEEVPKPADIKSRCTFVRCKACYKYKDIADRAVRYSN